MQMEFIKCNMEVAMETIGKTRNLKAKTKMVESGFALSDEIVVDQLKLDANKKKSTQTWLNVWEKWEMKENSTPNWRSTSTKISIKSIYQRWIRVRTESLKSMLAAFDPHLKERDYKYSITRDRDFINPS